LIGDGLLFDAAVAWRRGNETGLVFTGVHDLHESEPAERPGLRNLWLGWYSAMPHPPIMHGRP
jgi:ribonucleotide monophosphatase NagD (HAD superfamily)